MNQEEVKNLVPGVYRLYWSPRTFSVASIGILDNGDHWFACANWSGRCTCGIAVSAKKWWDDVVRVQLIEDRKGRREVKA